MEPTSEPKSLYQLDQSITELGLTEEANETYHGSIGLSNTGLKNFAKTPMHFLLSRSQEVGETDSQRLGTLAHMALLEPERFETTVQAIEGHRGSKEVKAAIAEAEARGKYVCKPDEYEAAHRVSRSLRASKYARNLLSGGVAERSIRWRDPETGVLLKCRPDFLRDDGKVIDLKTFDDLRDESIARQIYKMKYHWQSWLYLQGAGTVRPKSNVFAHIFVEPKTGLHRIVVLDDASLERAECGNDKEPGVRGLINLYAQCLRDDNWPGYGDEIINMSLPSYAW